MGVLAWVRQDGQVRLGDASTVLPARQVAEEWEAL